MTLKVIIITIAITSALNYPQKEKTSAWFDVSIFRLHMIWENTINKMTNLSGLSTEKLKIT